MESVFSAASRRTNSQGEKKGAGRDGALKTDWTKPWHGAASYGDRMAPAMVSGDGRAAWSAGFEAQAAIMEGAPGWLCAGGGTRRVRAPLLVGSAVRSCSGLVAASASRQVPEPGGMGEAARRCRPASASGRDGGPGTWLFCREK